MGATNSKKPEISLRAIRSNTEDIRTSLRRKQVPLQSKEDLHQVLINNSKQLNTIRANKSKKKQLEIDQLQKLVRDVNEELLVYNDQQLDKNADESHSFIHVGGEHLKNRKQKTPRKRKNSREKPNNKRPPNINDIEQKLAVVKDTVTTGLKNNDLNLLQSQKKIIADLSTDLELLNIPQTSTSYTQKLNLEKDLRRYYQKIIRREKNKDKPNARQSEEDTDNTDQGALKLRNIEILLEEIHNILQNNIKDDNCENLNQINNELTKIEKELGEIQNTDDSTEKSKTLLMKKVIQSEEFVREMEKKKEMNDLDELMDEIDKLKTEVQIQKETNKGKVIQEIESKRRKLKNLEVKHKENEKFRDDYLEELDNFLEKIQPNNYSVVMRQKKLKASKSLEDLIHLQEEWSSLQKKMSVTKVDEAKKVNDLLEKFEESIRAKRQSLTKIRTKEEPEINRRKSEEIIRTSAKIYELPKIKTTKSKEDVEKIKEYRQSSTNMKYGSIEYALEEITKISDRVEEIGKEVISFDGVTENLEYNFFTAALMEKKTVLNKLKHKSGQVDAFKNEVLEKIDFYEEYLKYKLNQNIAEEKIKNKLDTIENKIVGSIQNINYNNLEVELSNCQKEITQIDNKEKNEMFKTRINYLRKTLKEKSKTEKYLINEENLTDTIKILTENEEYIKTLKENVENTRILDVNQCALIEECLTSKTLELINLNVKNDSPSFAKIKKLLEEIETCKNLVKTKRRTGKEIQREIEKELDEIQVEISFFEGLPNDEHYKGLMRSLGDLEVKLCTVRGTEENLELSLRINYLKNRLEKLSLVSERMSQIEGRVREMLEIVSEGIPEENFNSLDEELINTKIELEKLEVSEKLSYRKITCLSYIEYLLKKMNEKMDKNRAQVSGSVLV